MEHGRGEITGTSLGAGGVHPRSRGGSDRISNLLLACIPCNQAKGNQLPKSHTLDALAVGKVEAITETLGTMLVAGCAGRGSYARSRPDKHGFPRLRLPRTKRFFSFATGGLVRAVVPKGKKSGTYTGRVAVRTTGRFNITTAQGTVQGIGHRHVRLLQRADGYAYTLRKEQGVSSRS